MPVGKTGLANEEVSQGRCERCGTPVERKDMRQWMLRITRYADRLLDDLDELDWPASTLAMQRNWIGRSEGAEVVFTSAAPVAGRGDPRLHDAPRHALRRDVHGARRPSTRWSTS